MDRYCTVSEMFNATTLTCPWNLGWGSFKVIGNGTKLVPVGVPVDRCIVSGTKQARY